MTTSLLKYKDVAPFTADVGLELVLLEDDRVVMALPDHPRFQNRKGDIHGGAAATLIDTTLGLAAAQGYPEGTAASTLALNISYIEAGRGRLLCTSRMLRRGKSIAFLSADVTDEQGTLVAAATGNFKLYIPR